MRGKKGRKGGLLAKLEWLALEAFVSLITLVGLELELNPHRLKFKWLN